MPAVIAPPHKNNSRRGTVLFSAAGKHLEKWQSETRQEEKRTGVGKYVCIRSDVGRSESVAVVEGVKVAQHRDQHCRKLGLPGPTLDLAPRTNISALKMVKDAGMRGKWRAWRK